MNDRFKFRIWDIKQQKYRQRTHHEADTCINCLSGKVLFGEGIEIYGEEDDKDVILEQCTGLEDKNGRLIYEGDILKCVHSDIMKYKIYWGRSCWRMKVYGTNNEIVDDAHLFLDTDILEVIGNIHENADLLGEDK